MDEELSKVREIIGLAESNSATDRRKFLQELQKMYANEDCVTAINSQTIEDFNSSTSWNHIMLSVHRVALLEVEKLGIKKSNRTPNIGYSAGLMLKTVSLATDTIDISLSFDDLMATLFLVWSNKTYKLYRDTYMNIFINHVLPKEFYRLKITGKHWREILRLSIVMYPESSDTFKSDLINAMILIIKFGSTQSHLVLDVQNNLLPFLANVYQEIESNGEEFMLKQLYKLTLSVCLEVCTESPIALGDFTKKSITSIIRFDGCPEMYKMLLILIKMQRPNGINNDNEDNWNEIILGIYGIIKRDIREEKLTPNFLKLCCEVYREILKDSKNLVDELPSCSADVNPPKIQRLSVELVKSPIDSLLLKRNTVQANWPFIQILTVLLRKYPEILRQYDYPEFLENISKLMEQAVTNNEDILSDLCELASLVIIKIDKENGNQEIEKIWHQIWETIVRQLGTNKNQIPCHELLRSIIQRGYLLNPQVFLRLYVKRSISWSSWSVKTLLTYCQYVSLYSPDSKNPDDEESVTRDSLLRWCLDIPESQIFNEIPIISFTKLLTSLSIKSSCIQEYNRYFNQEDDYNDKMEIIQDNEIFQYWETKNIAEIEKSLLSLIFRVNIFETNDKIIVNEQKQRYEIQEEIFNLLIDFQIIECLKIIKIIEDKKKLEISMNLIITKITIIAKIISNFMELKIVTLKMTKLIDEFNKLYVQILSSLITKKDELKKEEKEIFETLVKFFLNNYNKKLEEQIIEKSFNSEFLSYIENYSFDKKCYKTLITNNSDRIIIYFCCVEVKSDITDKQIKLANNFMNLMNNCRCVDRNGCINRIMRLISYCSLSEQIKNTNYLQMTIDGLKMSLNCRGKDERVVRMILKVISRLIKINNEKKINLQLLNIIIEIDSLLITENYGLLVNVEFVKILGEIIQLSPMEKWKLDKLIIDYFIDFIDKPFYTVRLQIIRVINIIFSFDIFNIDWKIEYLKKIINTVKKMFKINDTFDELETKKITVLQILAAVVHGSNDSREIHSLALLTIIELLVDKNIQQLKIKESIIMSARNINNNVLWPRKLIEMNLYKLLTLWIDKKYSLELFPWILTDSTSHENFAQNYIDIIVTIKFQRDEFNQLINFCNNIDISFGKMIENAFPSLIVQLLSTNNENSRIIHEKLKNNSHEFSAVKKFKDLLNENLTQIVVNIVSRLYDEENFSIFLNGKKYDITADFLPLQPTLDYKTVDKALELLEYDLNIKTSIVEYLVTKYPNVLQKILLILLDNINGTKTFAFHQYIYFYNIVTRKLSEKYFDKMANYIIRDFSHSLLNFIVEDNELSEIACSYFVEYLVESLPSRVNEIDRLFNKIISTLVPLTKKINGTIKILRYLIIDNKELFSTSIGKLDSLPNDEIFKDMKKLQIQLKYGSDTIDLQMEIKHFLNALNDNTNCSLEGLVDLNKQLSIRKFELRKFYNKLEISRGFSEDCATSILHKLIIKLVNITKNNSNEISIEASKCLGQLGPADLTTIILNPDTSYHGGNIEMFTIDVMKKFANFIVDNDINLRKTSANGLYYLFTNNWAVKYNNKIDPDTDNNEHFIYQNIYPFLTEIKKTVTLKKISINFEKIEIFIETKDLWIPVNTIDFSKWIIDITSKILDCFVNFYTDALKPVSQFSVEFSSFILPRLIYLLIKTNNTIVNRLSRCINKFFGTLFNFIQDMKKKIKKNKNIYDDTDDLSKSHECIRCMLNVVNCMRIHAIESNEIIPLDYLFIANAADYISAYFTSLLYAEFSCRKILLENSVNYNDDIISANWISSIDLICDYDPLAGELLQHIVREACLHIGDPDSIYGCGLSHLINSNYRAQHYTHLKQWDKVILEQDMQLNCEINPTSARRDMLIALQQSGHQSLAGMVIKSTLNEEIGDADVDEDLTYETAWRLADWSQLELPSPTATTKIIESTKIALISFDIEQNVSLPIHENYESQDYHYSRNHYRSLEYLRDGNNEGLENALIDARTSVVESLRNTNLECSQTVYPMLSKLQMLREIQEFESFELSKSEEWRNQDYADSHDFQYIEPILSQRLSLYQIQKFRQFDQSIDHELINTQFKIARIAEKQGFLSAASRTLNALAENKTLSDTAKHYLDYHKALLAWKEDQRDIGRHLLRDLINNPNLDSNLRSKALRICGNWMAENKCENPQTIINNYYEESIDSSRSLSDINALTDAQADLGQFADFQYQQIMRFAKSTLHDNLPEMNQQKSSKSRRNSSIIDNDDEIQEAINAYRELVTNDGDDLEDINREKDMYLMLAANNFLMVLQNCTNHDILIFRLMSLWLENSLHVDLNELLRDSLSRIASHKFIILLCQVAPHMSNVSNIFTMKINDLMERCAVEHPHHTLPVLLALKNTYKDEEFKGKDVKAIKRRERENRVIATDALVIKLSKNPKMRPIIKEISQLSEALIMLAYYSELTPAQAKKLGMSHNIPRTQAITKIHDFNHTTVPTITLSVNPNGKYENIIGIQKYETKYKIPGGINAPKIVVCLGTDGLKRRELVKGQDDLRQDAVMQQVCTVVNSMLKSSRETKRRRLHIRTYKIVPLSRRSGVLEWCENTLPITHVLTDVDGVPGMHTKYYPNDWSVKKCYTTLSAAKDKPRSEKLAIFLECCKNLNPAFHHFFMEKYPSAETWFERRLAYVRSVATTSMIGYILGLGDRHFSNILIDQTTAEVIHIDFGIAFAQGKVLTVPETVPFRLTRDLVVAMGICGVEGVFRRSCEETLNVLRERRETLITVLQVLIYDPLFSWSITPTEKNDYENSRVTPRHLQVADSKKTNDIAEKALLKIDEKLQGRSADGLVLSIPGQVERLIQQARDPSNLCRIYCGWQPYL